MSDSILPPIVAIGASAGGLDALERFFTVIPADTGMTYIVVQHLSPDFKSFMDYLLARRTSLSIQQAGEGLKLLPDTIYLNPPKQKLTIVDGAFHLMDAGPVSHGGTLLIDGFLSSVAKVAGSPSTAIIFSGTGTDGARGIVDIHNAGGKVYVQSAETAKFDGMPRASINTGIVDFIGSPEDIAKILTGGVVDPSEVGDSDSMELLKADESDMDTLHSIIRKTSGLDFSQYTPNTVSRRLERRLQICECETLGEYLVILEQKADEREALLRDLLIEVTMFYRDPKAFDLLRNDIIPEMISTANDSLRVWVAGCATGEEAYTWAILLKEAASKITSPPLIKIFATDVHRTSLSHASRGVYTQASLDNLPEELRDDCFEEYEGGYRVYPDIRQMIVFAEHNILKDPPFTRVDVVSCRNLMIYLNTKAQQFILTNFHFALKKGGVLFLGPSETLGPLESEFVAIDRHWRIHRRASGRRIFPGVPLRTSGVGVTHSGRHQFRSGTEHPSIPIQRQFYDQLLERYIPCGFLITVQGALVHTFGDAGKYLKLKGPLSTDLYSMLHGDLRSAVISAVQRTLRTMDKVIFEGIQVPGGNGEEHGFVNITVDHIFDSKKSERLLFVQLAYGGDLHVSTVEVGEPYDADTAVHQRIMDLESQLQSTRENLQALVEELETSNEELQATNEELLASNEELQSTNEDLQSVNEELYTVNVEYERKNEELIEVNRDITNLMNCTDIGTIFLNDKLIIRKFTPSISHSFRLRNQDVGRPLEDMASLLESGGRLLEDAEKVLKTGETIEREVKNQENISMLQRVTPYRTEKGNIEGVAITFVDLTQLRVIEEQLKKAQTQQRAILDSISANVAVLNSKGDIIAVNTAWEEFGLQNNLNSPDKVGVGANYFATCVGASGGRDKADAQSALSGIRDVLRGRVDNFEMEYPCHSPNENRWYIMRVTPLKVPEGGAVVMHINISDMIQAQRELEHMSSAISSADISVVVLDPEGKIRHANPTFLKMTGYTMESLVGESLHYRSRNHPNRIFHDDFLRRVASNETWSDLYAIPKGDGGEFNADLTVSPVRNSSGELLSFLVVTRDVTEIEHLNEQIRQTQKMETVGQLAGGVAHDFNNLLTPIIGYSELLLESPEIQESKNYLGEIHKAALRAQDLTQQLLVFSRRQPMKLVSIDLNEVVRDIDPLVRRLLRENIRVNYRLMSGPLPVRVDKGQIEQVLLNLAVNAQDSMAEGGVMTVITSILHVGPEAPTNLLDLPEGSYGVLSVRDVGTGIDNQHLTKIFEPFFTTKNPGKGTGLGLSTTYGIAKQNKGSILVKSHIGKGSLFSLCIPLESYNADDQQKNQSALQMGNGEYILVVEDDPGVRDLTIRILEKNGYRVTVCPGAQEAIDFFKSTSGRDMPDLLLTDVVMPDINGRELVEQVGNLVLDVQVLYMSGYPREALAKDNLIPSDTNLLNKPFDTRSLLNSVRAALDESSVRRLVLLTH